MFMPEFDFHEVKKNIIIFQKENGNNFTLLIIFIVKSLQIELLAQIHYYNPQSTGINLQSPQSDLTPWILTLVLALCLLVCTLPDPHSEDCFCRAQGCKTGLA